MKRIVATLAFIAGCARTQSPSPAQTPHPGLPPAPPPALLALLGEYDAPAGMRVMLENDGKLVVADTVGHGSTLVELSPTRFSIAPNDARSLLGASGAEIDFERDASGRATAATIAGTRMARRVIEPQPGTSQLRVTPVRAVSEVRVEALAASPPKENGNFVPADLVELTSLDRGIKLEIRYATTNNFLGTRFYDEARAFMQRPAAEAVVRAHRALAAEGYGLLIHDAYRPWYVTKMFWDATPLDKRWLVANPASGSKHNRGEAVDLTLYDLGTGQPVEMPSTYDESTDRAYANYPGGTTQQRWRRAVLRRAMEAQGFTVNPTEWWHFDYKDWKNYAIGNVPFDKITRR